MTDALTLSDHRSEGEHTPGPWAWFGNAKNNEVYLATVNRGRTYVMGFDRWGMRGAQPSFQPYGRGLVPASELLTFEVGDKSVRGVDAAKADESVYRLDISGIDCADARLIAAAPDLVRELTDLVDWLHDNARHFEGEVDIDDVLARPRAAIARATHGDSI